MKPDAHLTFELREAAKNCPNVLTRKMLRDSADDVHRLIAEVYTAPNLANLTELNGAVAKAMRTLSTAEQTTDDNPRGGAMPLPERRAA